MSSQHNLADDAATSRAVHPAVKVAVTTAVIAAFLVIDFFTPRVASHRTIG